MCHGPYEAATGLGLHGADSGPRAPEAPSVFRDLRTYVEIGDVVRVGSRYIGGLRPARLAGRPLAARDALGGA